MEQVANKSNTQAKPQVAGTPATKPADKDAEFKAKKAAAAKKFAENQKAKKEAMVKFAKTIVANEKIMALLSAEDKAYISGVANPPVKAAGTSRTGFFEKVFGNEAKVGDSITLMDYMKKTLQAKGTIDKAIKGWAEKGITVEYQENKAEPFNSKYVIKAMPKA